MPIKTRQFVKLYKTRCLIFFFSGNRGALGTQSNINGGILLLKKVKG